MKSRRRFLRPRFIVPIVLVLLAGTGGYFYLCYHFPEGEGPAGPAVPPDKFGQAWSQRKVLLLGLGDSITDGFGAPKGYGYFERLVRNPPDEFEDMRGRCLSAVLPNLTARNLAVSASNSIYHLDRQIRPLATQPADVLGLAVMTTGGNDVIHSYGRQPPCEGAMYGSTVEQARPWVEAFGQRLNEMVGLLEQKFPGGCVIFLVDIYDPTDGKGVPWIAPYPAWPDQVEILRLYNEEIYRLCQQRANVHLVPMHEAFLGHGLCCSRFWEGCYRRQDPTVWYARNIEDPNPRGYDAIRRLFLIEMAEHFRQ